MTTYAVNAVSCTEEFDVHLLISLLFSVNVFSSLLGDRNVFPPGFYSFISFFFFDGQNLSIIRTCALYLPTNYMAFYLYAVS